MSRFSGLDKSHRNDLKQVSLLLCWLPAGYFSWTKKEPVGSLEGTMVFVVIIFGLALAYCVINWVGGGDPPSRSDR